ncbi:MAG: hypothetical protein R6U39_03830 [Candidatus Aegiribacteria sp.]
MKCPDFDTLMMFLDGELRDDMMRQVSEHLRSCDRCGKVLASQRRLERSWRDDFEYPENDEFRRAEDELFRRMHRSGGWKVLLPAAAGIIAALLGVKLILGSGPTLDRVSAVARSRMEQSVHPAPEALEAEEEPAVFQDSAVIGRSDDLETPESAGESMNRDIPDAGSRSYGLSGYTAADEAPEETEEMLRDATEGTAAARDEALPGSSRGETAEEQVEVDGMAGGLAAMEEAQEPAITLSLDSDTMGLETVSTETTRHSGDLDSAPESSYWIEEAEAEPGLLLVFDAGGWPDSATALLLDSLLPDWRDYIQVEFEDTVMVVPPDDLDDLIRNGSILPEQATE